MNVPAWHLTHRPPLTAALGEGAKQANGPIIAKKERVTFFEEQFGGANLPGSGRGGREPAKQEEGVDSADKVRRHTLQEFIRNGVRARGLIITQGEEDALEGQGV